MQKPLTEFQAWPKIPRASAPGMLITEKIDGTNAQVIVRPLADGESALEHEVRIESWAIAAASRTRFVTPGADNFGFAGWVWANALALTALGPGRHYGEWYGAGIQRTYGLAEKRFALFYARNGLPDCVSVVPTLFHGPYAYETVEHVHAQLVADGSRAVPGFMKPEGVVVQILGAGERMKITDLPKGGKK